MRIVLKNSKGWCQCFLNTVRNCQIFFKTVCSSSTKIQTITFWLTGQSGKNKL